MSPDEKELLMDIIKCPISCPRQCNTIVSIQAFKGYWQIPEPWNGSLASGFLIIAGNPALDDAELYPATSSSTSLSWVGPGIWSNKKDNEIVEDFFEGRFGKSTNPAFHPQKYVDVSTNPPSILLKTSGVKNPKNPYWEVANKICSLLSHSFVPWSFAFTDIVHCKSSSGQGNPPYNTCRHHTKAIIDLFVRMSSEESIEESIPTVILIGAPANKQKDYFFGKNPVTCNSHLGSYLFKHGKVYTKYIIDEAFIMGNGKKVRVISGIPAPSAANCQVSNVKIGATKIW